MTLDPAQALSQAIDTEAIATTRSATAEPGAEQALFDPLLARLLAEPDGGSEPEDAPKHPEELAALDAEPNASEADPGIATVLALGLANEATAAPTVPAADVMAGSTDEALAPALRERPAPTPVPLPAVPDGAVGGSGTAAAAERTAESGPRELRPTALPTAPTAAMQSEALPGDPSAPAAADLAARAAAAPAPAAAAATAAGAAAPVRAVAPGPAPSSETESVGPPILISRDALDGAPQPETESGAGAGLPRRSAPGAPGSANAQMPAVGARPPSAEAPLPGADPAARDSVPTATAPDSTARAPAQPEAFAPPPIPAEAGQPVAAAAGPAGAAAPTEAAARVPVATLESALPARIEWLASRGGGMARLQLDPPQLGEVEIAVRVRGQHVELVIRTEQPGAHQLVGDSRERLVEALAGRELRVDSLELRGPDAAQDGPGQQNSFGHAGERAFQKHAPGQRGPVSDGAGVGGSEFASSDAASPTLSAHGAVSLRV